MLGSAVAACARFLDGHTAGDRVGLVLSDVWRAVGLVCFDPVGPVDRPLKRAGKAGRVAVLDSIEHDLVSSYEFIDVHVQMCCAGMADELRRQPRTHIA